MEKPAYVISASYAILIKNMYVTAFYATIIPISLVISSFQIYIFMWVERVTSSINLVKHNKTPNH